MTNSSQIYIPVSSSYRNGIYAFIFLGLLVIAMHAGSKMPTYVAIPMAIGIVYFGYWIKSRAGFYIDETGIKCRIPSTDYSIHSRRWYRLQWDEIKGFELITFKKQRRNYIQITIDDSKKLKDKAFARYFFYTLDGHRIMTIPPCLKMDAAQLKQMLDSYLATAKNEDPCLRRDDVK